MTTLKIKELDLDIIQPNHKSYNDPEQGGHKIVMIGKPGTGKSTLIKSILYNKRNIIPAIMVQSGTENENKNFEKCVPTCMIEHTYNEDKIQNFISRQKIAKRQGLPNPWSILLLDDCVDDKKIFNKKMQQSLFKLGRHWKMLYICSLQYAIDMPPAIRASTDGVFILREPNLNVRRSIWTNYAGIIPTFEMFCDIMDQLTEDFTAVYINNSSKSNKIEDCVFWYKAPIIPERFKFGSTDFWDFCAGKGSALHEAL